MSHFLYACCAFLSTTNDCVSNSALVCRSARCMSWKPQFPFNVHSPRPQSPLAFHSGLLLPPSFRPIRCRFHAPSAVSLLSFYTSGSGLNAQYRSIAVNGFTLQVRAYFLELIFAGGGRAAAMFVLIHPL